MQLRKTITSLLARVPAKQRRQLKATYERVPGFGRRTYYAQYGEDAFLQGYFHQKLALNSTEEMQLSTFLRKTVGPGYYVDVGANAPILFSNTYWFYKRGWRGINIDAAPGSAKLFERIRPHDCNMEALISDQEAELAFYHWDTPFLVNTLSADHARYMARLTGREPKTINLRSRRLDSVLNEHLPPDQAISFMSIDAEGHDVHVLRSNDWDRFRPELVLVEDSKMAIEDPSASEVYQFMRGVGYEMYAWLRPTVVFRQIGLRDWLVSTSDE
jgi:FkbM family methyltransferase